MAPLRPLPKTHRALILPKVGENLSVQQLPTPKPTLGSAIVQVLVCTVLPYCNEVYSGKRPYPFPTPFVPGLSAIGRVAAVGEDASNIQVGDLVMTDCFVRARDDHSICFLQGLHNGESKESKELMTNVWRDGAMAEYFKCPLENISKLPEPNKILGQPSLLQLLYHCTHLVPFGGFVDVDLKPGETCIVAPATGFFGGAAVETALAMGANVVAAGRNIETLNLMERTLNNPRLRTVQLTGDIEADSAAMGPAHVYQDWSPAAAAKSTHIKACLKALKDGGRASMMGGILVDVSIPYRECMHRSLKICFQWMYQPRLQNRLVEMITSGLFQFRTLEYGASYKLEEWQQAFKAAAEHPGWSTIVALQP